MTYHYNAAGQRFPLTERPLEPSDCWSGDPAKPDEEECDRWEEEQQRWPKME